MSRDSVKIILGVLALVGVVGAGLYFSGVFSSDDSAPQVLEETAEPDFGLLPEDPVVEDVDYKEPESAPSGGRVVDVNDQYRDDVQETVRYVVQETTRTSTTTNSSSEKNSDEVIVPPPPPTVYGPRGVISTSSPRFSFSGDEGARFRCSLNRQAFSGAKRCGTEREFSGLRDGKYVLRVWQITKTGVSGYQRAQFYIDTTPPPTPRITDAPQGVTSSPDATIRWQGAGSRPMFVCQARRDSRDGEERPCSSPLRLSALSSATYTIYITQIDRAGNRSPRASIEWTVDRKAPSAPKILSGPSSGSTINTDSATFLFSGEEGASFRCSFAGEGSELSNGSCQSPARYEDLENGVYTFSVRQQDRAGNTSSAVTRQFIVRLPESRRSLSRRTLAEEAPSRQTRSGGGDSDNTYDFDSNNDGEVDPQSASDSSDLEIDVLAAIEIVSQDETLSDSVAPGPGPVGGSASFVAGLDLRSNLSWGLETSLDSLFAKGVNQSLLAEADTSGATIDDGQRNGLAEGTVGADNANNPQEIAATVEQDVSWGDEAGTYTTEVTHTASQDVG